MHKPCPYMCMSLTAIGLYEPVFNYSKLCVRRLTVEAIFYYYAC
jgi:hypothetical protein